MDAIKEISLTAYPIGKKFYTVSVIIMEDLSHSFFVKELTQLKGKEFETFKEAEDYITWLMERQSFVA